MMDGLQPLIPGKVASLQATDPAQLFFIRALVTLRCVWEKDPLGLQCRDFNRKGSKFACGSIDRTGTLLLNNHN